MKNYWFCKNCQKEIEDINISCCDKPSLTYRNRVQDTYEEKRKVFWDKIRRLENKR